jgi:hypothetical protein
MSRNHTRVTRLSLIGIVVLAGSVLVSNATSFAGSITFDVKTTVQGTANTKIGGITATMAGPTLGNLGAAFAQTGVFTFTAPQGQLDDYYDFRWYQIITAAPNAVLTSAQTKFKDKDGNYTVAPTVPFVDPPAGGYKYQEGGGGADNDPFYENSGNGAYAFPNHSAMSVANTSSSTEDSPGPAEVYFETYLVVAGGDIGANKFGVLAGYSWNTHLDGDGVLVNTSPVQINAFNLPTLQSALNSSGFKAADYNNAWTAVAVTNLIPEPSSVVLAMIAGVFACGMARRRRVA